MLLALALLAGSAHADEPDLVEALQGLGDAVGGMTSPEDIEALLTAAHGQPDLGDLLADPNGLAELLGGGKLDVGDLLGGSAGGGMDLGALLGGGGADLLQALSGAKPKSPPTSTKPTPGAATPTDSAPRLVVLPKAAGGAAALSLSGDQRVVPVLLPGAHITRVAATDDVPEAWRAGAVACLSTPGSRLALRVTTQPGQAPSTTIVYEEVAGEAAAVAACLTPIAAGAPAGDWQLTRGPKAQGATQAGGGIVVHH